MKGSRTYLVPNLRPPAPGGTGMHKKLFEMTLPSGYVLVREEDLILVSESVAVSSAAMEMGTAGLALRGAAQRMAGRLGAGLVARFPTAQKLERHEASNSIVSKLSLLVLRPEAEVYGRERDR